MIIEPVFSWHCSYSSGLYGEYIDVFINVFIFMPPTSSRGHIGLGLSMHACVHVKVTLTLGQEPLELGC